MKGIFSVAINGRKCKSGYAAYNKDYICDLKQCDLSSPTSRKNKMKKSLPDMYKAKSKFTE